MFGSIIKNPNAQDSVWDKSALELLLIIKSYIRLIKSHTAPPPNHVPYLPRLFVASTSYQDLVKDARENSKKWD